MISILTLASRGLFASHRKKHLSSKNDGIELKQLYRNLHISQLFMKEIIQTCWLFANFSELLYETWSQKSIHTWSGYKKPGDVRVEIRNWKHRPKVLLMRNPPSRALKKRVSF